MSWQDTVPNVTGSDPFLLLLYTQTGIQFALSTEQGQATDYWHLPLPICVYPGSIYQEKDAILGISSETRKRVSMVFL